MLPRKSSGVATLPGDITALTPISVTTLLPATLLR